jgi:hypothetical protein
MSPPFSCSTRRQIAHSTVPATINKKTADRELRRENLNVSKGGIFYERAASRRSRHRLALQAYSEDAVPLKRKSATATNTTAAKKPKVVFQDDREEQDKHLDWRTFKRTSILRESIPSLAHAKKQEVQVVKPVSVPDRLRKLEVLKKQESIRQALAKQIEKQIEKETKKIDSLASKRASLILQAARAKVSPPIRKKICPIEPTIAMPTVPNTRPAVLQSGVRKAQMRHAHKLPKVAMRRKPVRPRVAVVSRVVSR